MQPKYGFAGTIGGWSARHPWRAIGIWIAFVAASVFAGNQFTNEQLKPSESAAGESGRAAQVLDRHALPIRPTEQVLVRSSTLTADAPGFRRVVADVMRRLERTPNVQGLKSPYASGAVSADRHAVLVSFSLPGTQQDAGARVPPALATTRAAQAAHPAFTIVEAGEGSFAKATADTQGKDFANAETLSMPITLGILIVAFGGLLLAGIPVALAMSAVVATLGLTRIASHLLPMTGVTKSVVLLIGLAVGVDYSIFMIARAREERAAGASIADAVATATRTSGRAVLVSGLTVVAAMSGMFLTGNKLFGGIALGTSMVVAVAVVGSLTVLPALLAPKSAGFLARIPGAAATGRGFRLVGRAIHAVYRVVSWPVRAPYALAGRARGERTIWERVLGPVLAHPWVSITGATAVLVALALPAIGLSLGLAASTDGLPRNLAVLKADATIRASFPGAASPAVTVIEARDVTAPAVRAAIGRFEQAALASGQVRQPITVDVTPDHGAAQILTPIRGSGHDAAASRATDVLRSRIVPATLGAEPAIDHAFVTGEAGGADDFITLMHDRAPLVIGFVLALSFVLLLVTFRSLVVPLKAIVLNLLSVGAAYGILVSVFQHGIGSSVLGVHSDGHIEAWLPIFLFVVLFGLSMDYHVFILSRVRELWQGGMTTEDAVAEGIRSTAGVVTSAAAVMVAVFALFATLADLGSQQLGIGLSSAILIDATIIRGVLLPAAMKVLGDRNWYLPSTLGWLPRVEHGAAEPEPATT